MDYCGKAGNYSFTTIKSWFFDLPRYLKEHRGVNPRWLWLDVQETRCSQFGNDPLWASWIVKSCWLVSQQCWVQPVSGRLCCAKGSSVVCSVNCAVCVQRENIPSCSEDRDDIWNSNIYTLMKFIPKHWATTTFVFSTEVIMNRLLMKQVISIGLLQCSSQ